MRCSMRLAEQWICLVTLGLAVRTTLCVQHTAEAPSTSTGGPHVEEMLQKPIKEANRQVDPLIASVLVKTYDSLSVNSFQSETLFREGQLVGKWKGCGADGVQFKDCKVIPAYMDRLSIEYTFDRNRLDEYTLHEPTIESRTTGATAELIDFSFRDDLRFTIMFRCTKRANFTSMEVFDLTIPILKDFAIETRFTKNCTSGMHPYVRLGAMTGGVPRLLQLPLERMHVAATTLTTDLFIRVSIPAVSQVHGLLAIKSSNTGIKVSLRGIASEETIVVGQDLRFSVLYECDVNGETDVNLVVPLPPWDDLRLRISKKCGGRVPEMLSIGTALDTSDIVKNGIPSPKVALSKADRPVVDVLELGEKTNAISLYLRNTNSEGNEVVHLGRMHFTVSDSGILRAAAEKYDGIAISAIAPGETVRENVRFICQEKGLATVMISLPILQYEVVEFRVEKRCRDPISYKESGVESWWTVGGIEDMAFVIVAMLLVTWCIRVRWKENGNAGIFGIRGYHRLSMSTA